jgi:hypothetical protein
MAERGPNIVKSSLSRTVTRNGITVRVEIVRLECENGVLLGGRQRREHVLRLGRPEAYAEFERTVAEEGMPTFLDSGKVIPFPRRGADARRPSRAQ